MRTVRGLFCIIRYLVEEFNHWQSCSLWKSQHRRQDDSTDFFELTFGLQSNSPSTLQRFLHYSPTRSTNDAARQFVRWQINLIRERMSTNRLHVVGFRPLTVRPTTQHTERS